MKYPDMPLQAVIKKETCPEIYVQKFFLATFVSILQIYQLIIRDKETLSKFKDKFWN